MADLGRYIRPFSFTAFVAGAGLAGSTILSYETFRWRNGYFALQEWRLQEKEPEVLPGDGVFWTICGSNTLVWIVWKCCVYLNTDTSIVSIMLNYCLHSPLGTVSSMLFSAFSHFETSHIATNMIVLYLYMPSRLYRKMTPATRKSSRFMGKETFLGFYLTAGVFAALGDRLFQFLMGTNDHGLGASGAIYAVIGYVSSRIPDHDRNLAFIHESALPIYPAGSWLEIASKLFTFSAQLRFSIACDVIGLFVSLLPGWKSSTGHACHLFGFLFGIGFCHMENWVDSQREKILMKYHHLRGSDADEEDEDQ